MTSNLVKVQQALKEAGGPPVWFYSITLQPEKDGPERLRRYAERYGVKPGWLFLTGKPEDVDLIRRSLGFTYDDPVRDADKQQHIGVLRYGNEPYDWWAVCPARSEPDQIVALIRSVDTPRKSASLRRK